MLWFSSANWISFYKLAFIRVLIKDFLTPAYLEKMLSGMEEKIIHLNLDSNSGSEWSTCPGMIDQGWSSVSYRRDLGMLKLQGRTNWKSRIKAQERAIRSSGPGFAWLKVRDKNWVKDIRGGADWVQQVAMQVVGIQEGQEALRLKYWIYHPCRQ